MKFGFCNKFCYLMEFIFLPLIYDLVIMVLYEIVNNHHVTLYSYKIPDIDLYLLLWINCGITGFVMVPAYLHQIAVIYYGGKAFRTKRLVHVLIYILHAILYIMLYYLCIIDVWNGLLVGLLIGLCIICIIMREKVNGFDEEEFELPK